jgi:hypothetical protein
MSKLIFECTIPGGQTIQVHLTNIDLPTTTIFVEELRGYLL